MDFVLFYHKKSLHKYIYFFSLFYHGLIQTTFCCQDHIVQFDLKFKITSPECHPENFSLRSRTTVLLYLIFSGNFHKFRSYNSVFSSRDIFKIMKNMIIFYFCCLSEEGCTESSFRALINFNRAAFLFNMSIGGVSPPIGTLMFVTCGVTNCKIKDFLKEGIPYFMYMLILLMLITYVPFSFSWLY